MTHKTRYGALLGGAMAIALGAGAAQAELDTIELQVITGNHTDPWTTQIMQPFFTQKLAEASGGKITAKATPYTELGLTGFEIMDLLKLGTNDISWGVPGYLSGDAPIAEGIELPGMTGDAELMFKVQEAYSPIFDKVLGEKYNSRLLFWSQQPALQGYCKLSEDEQKNFSLDTMKGKKIRVHSTSFADFVESFGGVPVTMGFADVLPSLERGVIDCALTSPTAAYGFKFGQVVNTVVEIRSGYSSHPFSMNLDTWNGLNAETQAFLTEQFAAVAEEARVLQAKVQADMAKCLTDGPCEQGEPAGMAYVKLSAEDEARLKKLVEEVVLPRWAERCGEGCAEQWNAAAGSILGLSIKTN